MLGKHGKALRLYFFRLYTKTKYKIQIITMFTKFLKYIVFSKSLKQIVLLKSGFFLDNNMEIDRFYRYPKNFS